MEAETLARKGLRIVERIAGPDHFTTQVNLTTLHGVLERMGNRNGKVQQILERRLATAINCHGVDSLNTPFFNHKLAVFHGNAAYIIPPGNSLPLVIFILT